MNRTETLEALTQLLHTGDEADRCYVTQALGKLTEPLERDDIVHQLLPFLKDRDIDVCVDTATTLGKLGGEGVTDALIESLEKDPDGEVKRAVAEALGELGDSQAIPGLIRVMEERDEGIEIIEDGWDLWWDVQLAAVKSLGKLKAANAVPNLLQLLDSEEGEDIEADILRALAEIDSKESIDALEQALKSSQSPRRQRRIVTALSNAQSADSTRILGRALQFPHPQVRAHTIQALESQNAKRYLPAIMLLIKDPNDEVRNAATHATMVLGDMKQPTQESIDLFIRLLEDESALVRAASLNTLANFDHSILSEKFIPNTDAVERVITLIGEHDIEASIAATRLLSKLNITDGELQLVNLLQDRKREVATRRQAALSLALMEKVGPAAVNALSESLRDEEKVVRLAALAALADCENSYQPPEADQNEMAPMRPLEIILAALRCEMKLVDTEVAGEHTDIGDDAAATDNVQHVQFTATSEHAEASNTDTKVPLPDFPESPGLNEEQHESLSTLDSIAMDNVEATLIGEVEDVSETPELDEETSEYLDIVDKNREDDQRRERRFKKADIYTDVRRMAATMLGRGDSERAIEALIETLQDDDQEIRRLAADALTEIATHHPGLPALLQAQGALISMANFGDQELRMAALRTLGQLENRAALPILLDGLTDDDTVVRMESIRALVAVTTSSIDTNQAGHMVTHEVSNEEVLTQLATALEDPQPSVRKYAADGITTLLQQGTVDLKHHNEMIQKILDAGFAGAGEQARHMGQALRILDSDTSSSYLLPLLTDFQSSAERRFVIEMLEEIHQPGNVIQSPEQRLLSRQAA